MWTMVSIYTRQAWLFGRLKQSRVFLSDRGVVLVWVTSSAYYGMLRQGGDRLGGDVCWLSMAGLDCRQYCQNCWCILSSFFFLFVIVTSTDCPIRYVSTYHLKQASLAEPCRQHKTCSSSSQLLTVQSNQESGWCSVGGCGVPDPQTPRPPDPINPAWIIMSARYTHNTHVNLHVNKTEGSGNDSWVLVLMKPERIWSVCWHKETSLRY